SGTGTCTVTMSQTRNVTATFTTPAPPLLTVAISGTGTVSSSPGGINCPGTCSQTFPVGSSVQLTAQAGSGWQFFQWSGDCTGGVTPCTVTMSQARSVTATFTQIQSGAEEPYCTSGANVILCDNFNARTLGDVNTFYNPSTNFQSFIGGHST